MDTVASNQAIKDGTLPKLLQTQLEQLHPEAAYFTATEGNRTAYIVFDLKDPSDIPTVAEPFFKSTHAKVDISPVMNPEDVQKGLARLG